MAKKDKAKEPDPPFNVDLRVPSFSVWENATVQRINRDLVRVSFRRKSSGYHDVKVIPTSRIIAIIGQADGGTGGSTMLVIEPSKSLGDVQRAFKLRGTIEETDTGLLEVTNPDTGAISFVNPMYADIIRPDDEVNKHVPRRGRRPKAKREEDTTETFTEDRAKEKLRKKKKLKDKVKSKDKKNRGNKVRRDSDW